MNELRKIEKVVLKYEILLIENPQQAKKDKKIYISDIEILIKIILDYIDEMSEKFQVWCDTSVSVWEEPTSNIFLVLKRKIDMIIVNYFLNKFSYNLSKAGNLEKRLKKIEERFNQFKHFC